MTKPKLTSRVLYSCSLYRVVLALVGIVSVTSLVLGALRPAPVMAATNTTLNFQSRLLQASGALVPDGYYNVSFKLYTTNQADGGETPLAASCTTNPGGVADEDCVWTESYYDTNGVTAGNDNRVRVVNGYLSVSLGSISAFPGTINWDQDLYITMNIGGSTQTATPTWDGEMLNASNQRMKLTGVPYAFRAGALAKLATDNTTSTLGWAVQSTARNILLPDEGGTVCIQSSSNCGFAPVSGSGNYIQNTTTLQTNSNFFVQSSADNISAGVIRQRADQITLGDADLLQFQNSSGTAFAGVAYNGAIYTANRLTIGQSSVNNGGALFVKSLAADNGVVTIQGADEQTSPLTRWQTNGGLVMLEVSPSGEIISPNTTGGNASLDLVVRSGNVTNGGTNNTGSLLLDTGAILGTGTGVSGNVNIGTTNASTVTLGRSGMNTNVAGNLQVGGTTVITSSQVLQNVTANTSILTSGVLGMARGGTGNDTYTTNGALYYDGTKFASTNAGTTGQCLKGNTGSAPTWGSCGVGSASTLQDAYDVSTGGSTPEIILDSTRNAITIRDAASTVGDLLDLQNGSGTSVLGISGTGVVHGGNIVSGTSNTAGGALTLAGGQGTGNASGGNIVLRVATPGASGTSVNSLSTIATFSGADGSLMLQNSANSTSALSVLDLAGQSILNVDTTNKTVGTRAKTDGSASAAFTLQSGNVSGGAGASGNVSIDSGSTSGTAGSLLLGTTNTKSITIGNTTGAATQTINIGTNATASSTSNINLGSSVAGTTAIMGTTTITDRATGSASTLVVNNSNSTGNILVLQDNGSPVLTVADGGNITATGKLTVSGSTTPTFDLTLGQGANRTIGVETRTTSGVGYSLSLQGGNAGGVSSNGGALNLTGGTATGTLTGGHVIITGGANSGTAGSAGGQVQISGGAGADSSTGTQAGAGAGILLQGGGGGNGTAGATRGNVGGVIQLTAGAGGNSFGAVANVNGGDISILTGDAGTGGSGAAASAGSLSLDVGAGTGTAPTISLGTATSSINKTITIGSTTQTGAITLGASTAGQTINIANGNTAGVTTVNILSGAGSASTASLLMGNNTRVTQIDLGNIAAAAARTINVGTGNNTVGIDTINIGTGNTSVANGKTINIGTGTPTGSGSSTITLGMANASLVKNLGATAYTATCDYTGVSGAVTLNTAGKTPDGCTVFRVTTTGAGGAITVPAPAAGAGAMVYVLNMSTSTHSFTLLGAIIPVGASANLVYNGSSWSFAGSDASAILNQTASTQTAGYNIQGASAGTSTATIIGASSATAATLVVKTGSSQSGDVQQILNNSNDILGRIDAGGNIVAALDPPATALTATAATGTGLNGTYSYVVTFVTAQGETMAGPVSNTVTTSGTQQMNLTNIPTGPTGTKARKVYRTPRQVNGVTTNWRYNPAIVLNDNTTTSATDTTVDTSLTYSPPMPIAAPSVAPFVNVLAGGLSGGSLSAGNYKWAVTYVTPWGETSASPDSVTATATLNQKYPLQLMAFPTKNITAMRVYRTQVNGSTYYYNPNLINATSGSTISGGGTITDPSVSLRHDGTADGTLNTNIIPPTDRNSSNRPTAPTAALRGIAGNLSVPGSYNSGSTNTVSYAWAYSYVSASGAESALSLPSATLNPVAGNAQARLTNVTAGPAGTVARKIYRTSWQNDYAGFGGDIKGPFVLVATIGDNSTTQYDDNQADSSLIPNYRPQMNGFAGAGATVNTLKVTAPQGTPPLVVTSTTMVKNLNAELLGGNDQLGIKDFTYNIDESLKHFRSALANANRQEVVVNVIGDSIMDGYGSSNNGETNIPGRLRKQLQTKYGNGGTGWQKGNANNNWVKYQPFTGERPDVDDRLQQNPMYRASLYGANGGGIEMCNNNRTHSSLSPLTAASPTGAVASMTLTFYGSKVDLQYTTGSGFIASSHNVYPAAAYGTLAYSIDNGAVVGTISQSGAQKMGNRATLATNLDPNVPHTIRVYNNASTAGSCVNIEGIDATYSKGVRVNNVSTGGSLAASYYSTDDAAIGAFSPTPDLVIMDWATNERTTGKPLQEFKINYQRWISQAKRASKPADCILIVPPIQNDTSATTFTASAYADVIYQLADENSCGVLDMSRKWNNSYSWAQTRGLFAEGSGAAGSDGLHPSDAGYADMASTLLEFMDRGVQLNKSLAVDTNLSINGGYLTLMALSAPSNITQDTPSSNGTLTAGDTYRYAITALNDYGESASSPQATFTVPAPVGLAGGNAIVLKWDPVPGATKYRVYRCNVGGCGAATSYPYYTDVYQTGFIDNGSTTWFRSKNDVTITAPGNADVGTSFGGMLLQGSSRTALNVSQATGSSVVNIDTSVNPNNLIRNSGFENDPSNLITINSGFEEGNTTVSTSGVIDGWTAKGTWGDVYRDSTTRYEGSSSMRMVVWTPNDGGKYPIRLNAGTYEVGFWIKTDMESAGTTFTAGYASNGSTETDCSGNITTVELMWRYYTCRFTLASDATSNSAYMYIEQNGTNALRNFYVDKITLKSMTTPTGWATKGSSTVSLTQTQEYAGFGSMQITSNSASAANGAKYNVQLKDSTSSPAVTYYYSLSFYAKLDSGTAPTLAAGYAYDGSTETACTLNTATITVSGWTRYNCVISTPTTASNANAYIYIAGLANSGQSIYVDSVFLTQTHTDIVDVFDTDPYTAYPVYNDGGTIQLNGMITSAVSLQNSVDSTNAFNIYNTRGIELLRVDTLNEQVTLARGASFKYLNPTFGSVGNAGAFIDNMTYLGEEFNDNIQAATTGDTANIGDNLTWYADVASTVWTTSQNGGTGGALTAVSNVSSGTQGVLFGYGAVQNVQNRIFHPSNLPVAQMKFKTSSNTFSIDYVLGFTDQQTVPTTADALPSYGIYFTNNNSGFWYGQIRAAGSTIATTAACAAISPDGFPFSASYSVLRIEVLSANTVRFLADGNASDGINFTDCGTLSGVNSVASFLGLSISCVQTGGTGDPTISLDYVRAWQDDTPIPAQNPDTMLLQGTEGATESNGQNAADALQSGDPGIEGTAGGDGTDTSTIESDTNTLQGVDTKPSGDFSSLNVSGESTLTSLAVAGSVQAQSLEVAGEANIGSLTVQTVTVTKDLVVQGSLTVQSLVVKEDATFEGNIKLGGLVNTKQNAIIRKFKASEPILPGAVVILDPEHDGRVKLTTVTQDTRIIGVAVTEAKNEGDEIEIAVGGQVQVGIQAPALNPGDLLVTDETAGAAKPDANPRTGSVLGKATSQKDTHTNKAWIMITLQ